MLLLKDLLEPEKIKLVYIDKLGVNVINTIIHIKA